MLRADESAKKIPVIAVTSYAMKGDREKFLKAGFDSYISKPINTKEVVMMIEQYIKK
jgi:CheY-like chemotaxis protein